MKNQLLEWIKKIGLNEIVVLLRHPPRGEPKERGKGYVSIPLTPEGERMAFELGRELPKEALVRVFHSPVPRCKETAQFMLEGIVSRGGSAVLMGERDFLGPQFITGPKDMGAMIEKIGGSNFAREWLNRKLDRKVMDDPYKVASNVINGLVVSMQEKNDSQHRIDIHVTHDWNMLSVKDILLNVKHEERGWPDYLDGVILTRDAGEITLRWRELTKTLDWEIGWKIVLKGMPASPGIVRGKVTRVITSIDDIGEMKEGEVLVASETNPQYVLAMIKSSAIVTDRGGIISHPAIVARELGIPGVVGTMNATKIIKSGWVVTVDGNHGLVLKAGSVLSS